MNYKEMTLEDINSLSVLYTKSFSTPPWNEPWTVEISQKRLTQMIKCDGFYGLIVYERDEMIGMILGNEEYSFTGLEFHIKEFCTSPSVRGKGLGSIILTEFELRLKARGVNKVALKTSRDDATEGFYNRRGYETLNEWILMSKNL